MKCSVYPYSDDLYPLISNAEELVDHICITAVIYPIAWKKSIVHTSEISSVGSGSDFEKLSADTDCVIFADISRRKFMYGDIIEKAEFSLSSGKDVIFCTKIKNADEERLREKYPERNIIMKYANPDGMGEYGYRHEDINCAALGISGLYRGLDDVAAITGITSQFRKKNIRTASVTTNATLSLLGYYHFPSEIFTSGMEIERQVAALNAFFKDVERRSKCDIMLIQFPDGIMKFIPDVYDSYGVKTFMISRAIGIDYFVLISLLEILRPEAYECIRSMISGRFGFSLDSCLIQPVKIDREYSPEAQKILYTKNGVDKAYEQLGDLKEAMKDVVFSVYDDSTVYERITESCISKLT